MSASFTEIMVSRKAEKAFRRRAIKAYPKEMVEALWGRVRGHRLYIHAFMPIDHKGTPSELYYDQEEFDDQEDQAAEEHLSLIGSVHTHPNCDDCSFSEHDLREVQTCQDTVMAVCAVRKETKDGKTRHKTEIVYWPAPRPMKIIYTE